MHLVSTGSSLHAAGGARGNEHVSTRLSVYTGTSQSVSLSLTARVYTSHSVSPCLHSGSRSLCVMRGKPSSVQSRQNYNAVS